MKDHILYYQQLLEMDPHNVEARLRLGALWRSMRRPDLAVPQYSAAARHLAREGFLLEAIAACKAIFEMEPQHTDTQLFLASLYARQPAGGAVARVALPTASQLAEDEIIVLEPSQAVQEIDDADLVSPGLSSEHDALELDPDDAFEILDAEPHLIVDDELDSLTTSELTPLSRDGASDDPTREVFDPAADELDHRATWERPAPQLPADPPRGVSINDPDRVLRRALNLSLGWEPPAPAPATTTTTDSSDAWPRPDTGARPLPRAPRPRAGTLNTDATRVAPIFTANTVIGAPSGDPPRPDPTGSTRVERPHPGAEPLATTQPRPAPDASSPSYDRYEVVSPAALSVTRRDVPDNPLFSRLNPTSFMELLRRIDLRRVPAGANVIDDTHRPLGLFIIVNGNVEVVRRLPDGTPRFLASMGRGEFFGEFELLTGRSHSATVRAIDAVDLLHISDEVIADLAENDPTIWDTLWDFYHQRLLNNLLATSEIFRTLDAHERSALADRFEPRFVDRGQLITRRGEPGTGLFLILSGAVEVLDPADEASGAPLAQLRDGDFFGAVSIATERPAAASLRAAVDCTLLLLPRADLQRLFERRAEAFDALKRLAESRLVIVGKTGYSRIGVPK